MFQRILVPLDGSSHAEHALPIAIRLARASQGSLILVRVVNTVTERWPASFALSNLTQTAPDVDLGEARQYLANLVSTSIARDIPVETEVRVGPITSSILSVAQSCHCDLIVLRSREGEGIARKVLGDIAANIAHRAEVPVLLLQREETIPNSESKQPLRLLVSLDGSTSAKAALLPAIDLINGLAAPTQGLLHLFTVVDDLKPDHPAEMELRISTACEYLRVTAQHLHKMLSDTTNGLPPITWSIVMGSDVPNTLVNVAEHGDRGGSEVLDGYGDLIAISTPAREGERHLATESVTDCVLHTTQLPVLVVHPSKGNHQTGELRASHV
jgi:nucleotide-binding universal stress UspA family protein